MEIEIDPRKSVHENIASYYEKAKKYKRKIKGIGQAVEKTEQLIEKEEKKQTTTEIVKKKTPRSKQWYEKFHWMELDKNFVLGGRDTRSNQLLVKKHMEKNDLFFHADIHGAAVIIAKDSQKLSKKQLDQIAVFAGCFSNAWKNQLGAVDVYAVKPEQVKLAAQPGQYLAKGSFVLEGKRQWFKKLELRLAIFYYDNKLHIVPIELAKKYKHIVIRPGKGTKGEAARKVLAALKELYPEADIDLDLVLQILPNGGSRIKT